jgi:hypothetical protein
MSVQSRLQGFSHSGGPAVDRYPDPPSDGELSEVIAPDNLYPFPVEEVAGIEELRREIRDIIFFADDTVKAWSRLLGDHISYGNKKVASETAIFNIGSAHDCVNLGTRYCQVSSEDCYAVRSEKNYPQPIDYRRRQAIIWSLLDGDTWARAFRRHVERKRNPVDALRFNEAGDFSTRQDILKLEVIGGRLNDIVDTYTYSASSYLPWSDVDSVVINQSNQLRAYGARGFVVVDAAESIPDGAIRCPNDLDESMKCGDCRLCLDSAAGDIYVKNFYADEENSMEAASPQSLSQYREAVNMGLSEEWADPTLEEEKNTVEHAQTILDGTVSHKSSDALIQLTPTSVDRDTDESEYNANRVLVQDKRGGEKYYIALTGADIDLPPEGAHHAIKANTIDESAVEDAASCVAYEAVHKENGSADAQTRTAFWTPDMAVLAVLAGAKEVASERVTQADITGFQSVA